MAHAQWVRSPELTRKVDSKRRMMSAPHREPTDDEKAKTTVKSGYGDQGDRRSGRKTRSRC
jgi:hypothetical protein